ncbi:MAG TPA: 23S rRNA (guanosine(2251)-2'-O)-methyltransferase RlmB [Acidobacteriota bacterium]|nr:23S rRNA (guanosine(2251)-2'-O)-methyltransferase RlmB [Acidobacteriota bacterium]
MDKVFGFHSAEEALRNNPDRVNHVWVAQDQRSHRIKQILDLAKANGIPVSQTHSNALARMAQDEHHQGIVLELSPYKYYDAEQLLDEVNDNTLFCILDEIQDATNLGTLIRTMEGAGVTGVFLPDRRSAGITSVTHRLSAGALEHVKVARIGNVAQWMEKLQERGVRIICADANASKQWHEADYSGPIAILVGNEQRGVRRLLKEKSDELVRVPMLGKVQSLNVNVAAAILLYEAVRQRKVAISP